VGDVASKPRDLGNDRGYRVSHVGLRQDAMKSGFIALKGRDGALRLGMRVFCEVGTQSAGVRESQKRRRDAGATGLPVYEAVGEGVVAGADAHGVVPGDGEGPPREATEDGLTECEGEDVALFGEEQAHAEAADEGDGNEDGIGPVQGAEDEA
jgi:hypothetical protein